MWFTVVFLILIVECLVVATGIYKGKILWILGGLITFGLTIWYLWEVYQQQ
jgi:hypothetical protein